MAEDIRIAQTWRGHKKLRQLIKRLGHEAHTALLDLWCEVANYHPRGILNGWDAEDIAYHSGWKGNPDEYMKALLDIRLLCSRESPCEKCKWWFEETEEPGFYRIHDWEKHQPYVFHAPDRSRVSKRAADIRWAKKSGVFSAKWLKDYDRKQQLDAPRNAPGNAISGKPEKHDFRGDHKTAENGVKRPPKTGAEAPTVSQENQPDNAQGNAGAMPTAMPHLQPHPHPSMGGGQISPQPDPHPEGTGSGATSAGLFTSMTVAKEA